MNKSYQSAIFFIIQCKNNHLGDSVYIQVCKATVTLSSQGLYFTIDS